MLMVSDFLGSHLHEQERRVEHSTYYFLASALYVICQPFRLASPSIASGVKVKRLTVLITPIGDLSPSLDRNHFTAI
jgi:hypothetical protein